MTDPTGIGAQIPDRYRGWLCFTALPDDLQRAEDATLAHDNRDLLDPVHCPEWHWYRHNNRPCFDRPATDTEKTLLAHLGFTVPDDLKTHVDRITPSVRRRRWPVLEATAQLPETTP